MIAKIPFSAAAIAVTTNSLEPTKKRNQPGIIAVCVPNGIGYIQRSGWYICNLTKNAKYNLLYVGSQPLAYIMFPVVSELN